MGLKKRQNQVEIRNLCLKKYLENLRRDAPTGAAPLDRPAITSYFLQRRLDFGSVSSKGRDTAPFTIPLL